MCHVAVVTKVLQRRRLKVKAVDGDMGRGRGAVVMAASTLSVQEAKHMVVAGAWGLYISRNICQFCQLSQC